MELFQGQGVAKSFSKLIVCKVKLTIKPPVAGRIATQGEQDCIFTYCSQLSHNYTSFHFNAGAVAHAVVVRPRPLSHSTELKRDGSCFVNISTAGGEGFINLYKSSNDGAIRQEIFILLIFSHFHHHLGFSATPRSYTKCCVEAGPISAST